MKKLSVISIILASSLALAGCNKKPVEQSAIKADKSATQTQQGDKTQTRKISVGVISGPETEVMQVAAKVAKQKYNLNVEIIEFNDYVTPNAALDDKSIDANAFQHKPYLDQTVKAKGYKLAIAGNTLVYPMGIFSLQYAELNDIPAKSKIAIPNDPSNGARALIMLHDTGLIKLKDRENLISTVNDIASNPKGFEFIELDAAMLPRTLQDVAAAVINNTFSSPKNMPEGYKQILLESEESPYVNIIVVRAEDKDKQEIKDLVSAFQSEEVFAKAQNLFTSVVRGWKKQ